jgi:hypothetical protein
MNDEDVPFEMSSTSTVICLNSQSISNEQKLVYARYVVKAGYLQAVLAAPAPYPFLFSMLIQRIRRSADGRETRSHLQATV